uniref:Uncharacterized protein n=1 Tax=Arundo donax TaxID=35708 RepID=A0A0A9HPX8_ARUDO
MLYRYHRFTGKSM